MNNLNICLFLIEYCFVIPLLVFILEMLSGVNVTKLFLYITLKGII